MAMSSVTPYISLLPTVMEIGEWVKADQYTGRIVSLANRVITGRFNYISIRGTFGTIMVPVAVIRTGGAPSRSSSRAGLTQGFHAEARAEFREEAKASPLSRRSRGEAVVP